MLRWLSNLLLPPKYELIEPNVPEGWEESEDWLAWDPPLSIVRGESNYQRALRAVAGKTRKEGYVVPVVTTLKREPQNKYDRNAIAALVGGKIVGYIAKEVAAQMSPGLDGAGCTQFEVAGVVRGGYTGAKSFGVYLWFDRLISDGPAVNVDDDLIERFEADWPPR